MHILEDYPGAVYSYFSLVFIYIIHIILIIVTFGHNIRSAILGFSLNFSVAIFIIIEGLVALKGFGILVKYTYFKKFNKLTSLENLTIMIGKRMRDKIIFVIKIL